MKPLKSFGNFFPLFCLVFASCSPISVTPPVTPPTLEITKPIAVPTVEPTPLEPYLFFRIINQDYQGGYVYRSSIQEPISSAWGPDDNLYIADQLGRRIIRMSPDGELFELPIKGIQWQDWRSGGPHSLAFSPDGKLFAADLKYIYSIEADYSAKVLISVTGNLPGGIAFSPDGDLYYSKRDPRNGEVRRWREGATELVVENLPNAEHLAFGLEGSLYISQMDTGMIYKVNTSTREISPFYSSGMNGNTHMGVDAEGDVWMSNRNSLLQIAPDGEIKPYVADGGIHNKTEDYSDHLFAGITFDPEGNLWVTDQKSRILKFTPAAPGAQEPKFTSRVMYMGNSFSALAINKNGELFGSEENYGKLMRIFQDGLEEISTADPQNPILAIDQNNAIHARGSDGVVYVIDQEKTSISKVDFVEEKILNMAFGYDGLLYAIATDNTGSRSLVKFDGEGKMTTLANSIGGITLGRGKIWISAWKDGLYLFDEEGPYLFQADHSGKGRRIMNQPEMTGVQRTPMIATSDGRVILKYNLRAQDLVIIDQEGIMTGIAYFVDPQAFALSPDEQWLYIAVTGGIIRIQIKLP